VRCAYGERHMIRTLTSWTLYPLLLTGALTATYVGLLMGWSPTLVVMAVIAGSSVPMVLGQLVMPYEEEWRASPSDVSLDLLHMASTGLTTEGWRSLTLGVMVGLAGWLSGQLGDVPWPTAWPVPLQVGLALIVGDFGAYWVHRLCHRYDALWRVHAMHHSSSRLYMFSSGRNHPGNAVLAYGSQLLPLTLLGAPIEVLALMSVFTGVHGMLQHANIEMRHGLLNHIFATAELHRWHHAANRADSDTNFGSNLILWDWVFRTRHLPADREVREVGLPDLQLPENFLHHLASPFVLQRYMVSEEVAGAEPTKSL